MKLMKYQARKMFRPMLAYVLALLTIISSVPFGVFANDGVETITEPELLQPFRQITQCANNTSKVRQQTQFVCITSTCE